MILPPEALREEQLKKAFFFEFANLESPLSSIDGKVIANICNWWLSKMESRDKELENEILKLAPHIRKEILQKLLSLITKSHE